MLKTLRQIASIVLSPNRHRGRMKACAFAMACKTRSVPCLAVHCVSATSTQARVTWCELEIHALNNPLYNLEGSVFGSSQVPATPIAAGHGPRLET